MNFNKSVNTISVLQIGFETTVCHPDWVQGVNRMDLNIVPHLLKRHLITLDLMFKMIEQIKSPENSNVKPIEVLFEGNTQTSTDQLNIFQKN